MTEQFYWCGWLVPDSIPDDELSDVIPANMKAWWTGSGEDHTIYVGLVWAPSGDDAMATVRSCYGECGGDVEVRWEPIAKGLEVELTSRFPMGATTLEMLRGE